MAIADGNGLPIAVGLGSGSNHDSTLVDETLDEVTLKHLPPRLIGDKAFDSAKLVERLRDERGLSLIAPQRSTTKSRKQDGRALRRYKRRWLVERLFAWLKRFRRIGTRFERKSENYLGFLHLACIVIITRRF